MIVRIGSRVACRGRPKGDHRIVITLELRAARGRNRTGAKTVLAAELTGGQWHLINDLFVERPTCGRPRFAPRLCLEGILWVLRSVARWRDLPTCFPSYPTGWRRLGEWMEAGVFEEAWRRVMHKLDARGRIDWRTAMADATVASAKKGVPTSVPPSGARAAS